MASSASDLPAARARRAFRLKARTRLRVLVRTSIRDSEIGQVLLAALIGGIIALGVALVRQAVREIHHLLFGVPFEMHLSGGVAIESWRLVAVPAAGGLAYGLVAHALRRWRPRDIVDAIEANALYGGRMSLTDSIRLSVLTVLSGGVGASVGLEAAYTQLGAGFASRIGRTLRLRRADLRTFVGCGAAAGIAAAFNAPLAGAFYAFELIIGSYTLSTLAPIAAAALSAALVERGLFGGQPLFLISDHIDLGPADYGWLVGVGALAAVVGIGAMVGVTLVEGWCRRIALPLWARPAAGGLLVGAMALVFPGVLGSGHGGILSIISSGYGLPLVLGLMLAKLAASALSIGSGFRGGMFSSSLFLGSLFGAAAGALAAHFLPWALPSQTMFILAGMGAVAAAVVGAPVTMILLVLEVTADFSATMGVTTAVIVASLLVRYWFGYSFATWRFHLRGVPLRGAYDVGWLQDLTVGRLMQTDVVVVPQTMSLRTLRQRFPHGTAKYVFVVKEDGRYAGIIDVSEAHSTELDELCDMLAAADLAREAQHFLTPHQPIRLALDLFLAATAETLAVVDNPTDRNVIGYLTEAYALRRYASELETRRREELGEDELFSPKRVLFEGEPH
jgi:CIC family chloride channel protein